MPPVGFEPTISAGERPKTHDLDRAATGTGPPPPPPLIVPILFFSAPQPIVVWMPLTDLLTVYYTDGYRLSYHQRLIIPICFERPNICQHVKFRYHISDHVIVFVQQQLSDGKSHEIAALFLDTEQDG